MAVQEFGRSEVKAEDKKPKGMCALS